MSRWLIAVIVIVVLIFFGHRYFGTPEQAVRQAQQAAQEAAGAARQAAQSAASSAQQAASQAMAGAAAMAENLRSVTLNGVDLGSQIGGAVDSIRSSLDGITDSASAQAAKGRLEEAGRTLDGVSAQVEQLPATGRRLLASALTSAMPALKAGADKVAGLSPDLKPTLDTIIARLETWARAPA